VRHRGSRYIDIAAAVLRTHGKPLAVEEIVRIATADGLLRSGGRSPASAMRARLSSELREHGFQSRFQRVGPNRFALREWELPEYIAPPFQKTLPDETVVCLPQSAIGPGLRIFGLTRDVAPYSQMLARPDMLSFHPRPVAEQREDLRQLVAYAVLCDPQGRILTYRRGHYSSAPSMLRGARCLGFGGHVLEQDARNLFGLSDAGVLQAAYREISEELAGTLPERLETTGLILDDSSPEGVRHLGFVIQGDLPSSFVEEHSSRERAVNDLQFLTPAETWQRFHEFEFWSQLVLRAFFPVRGGRGATVIRPRRRTVEGDVVVVAGEIGAGKSTCSELLCTELGFSMVSTRACVARLLSLPDFEGGDRAMFQEAAANLISSEEGTRLLAEEIAAAARGLMRPIVIDGVRQQRTVQFLRNHFSKLVVLFIDCARDDAFRNFRSGTGRDAQLSEFRDARAHPVEQGVTELKHEADVYIFNGGDPRDMLAVFRSWWVSSGGPQKR
jgi:predicted NUDIX family phosphoesterase/dephospho-CoA kinase